ncbi:tonB-system energizer ExbB [Pseudomonas sp. 21C1]|nr:tonB-system energizer ExbB [Pseudomonas sp. 21C1]
MPQKKPHHSSAGKPPSKRSQLPVLLVLLTTLAAPLIATAGSASESPPITDIAPTAVAPAVTETPEMPPEALPEIPVQPPEAAHISAKLSPQDMYQQADSVVRTIMIVLMGCSVLSWTIWLGKAMELSRLHQRLRTSLKTLGDMRRLQETKIVADPIAAKMLDIATLEVASVRREGYLIAETLNERVAARIGRVEMQASKKLASNTGILASIAAVAPFVGLLGTVWGIMNSFTSIAQMQTTNLAVVAPGIAEALLATAMGLFAAIPAVVLYNILSRQVGNCRVQLGDLSTQVMCLLSREVDYLQPVHSLSKAV